MWQMDYIANTLYTYMVTKKKNYLTFKKCHINNKMKKKSKFKRYKNKKKRKKFFKNF